MPIVGGLDIHRKQITFDYLDTATGEVRRGQIAPADRAHLRAWHLAGARALQARLYGVGPLAGLAMTCWPGGAGRFSSARKAVRFAGLDVTVYSSDGKRSPGHLSRQGPEILRWVAYEAGKTHGRASAPGHDYYAAVKDRTDGKIAALSQARKLIRQACHILAELGDDALTAA